MLRFVLFFSLLLLVFFSSLMLGIVQQIFIQPWTEYLAHFIARLLMFFDSDVLSQGSVIRSHKNGFAISIVKECNGVDAMLVFLAAVLAFPAPWRYRVKGLVLGVIAIQGINIVRIMSLYYLGQFDKAWFDWAHLYVWQAMIMLVGLLTFLLWLQFLPASDAEKVAAQ